MFVKYIKEHTSAFIVLLLILFIAAAYTTSVIWKQYDTKTNSAAGTALSINDEDAPFTDMSGNVVSLTDHVGKILIVTSWASWSPASANDLKFLAELVNQYGSETIKVVAINRAESAVVAERYLKTLVVADSVELVLDPDDKYYRSIGGYAMPETILYNQKGEEILHIRGDIRPQQMQETLSTLLTE